jgi:RND family efflux transporter MFP subunit
MVRKIVFPLLALCGIAFAIFMIFISGHTPPKQPLLFTPPQSPYMFYVAGEGTVESLDENVEIGVSFSDVISNVYIRPGQEVHKGDLIFKIDTRQQESDLQESIRQFYLAKKTFEETCQEFSYYEQLKNRSAVSKQAYTQSYYQKAIAFESLKVAAANVRRIETMITRAHIRAPSDGQILQRNVRVGAYANVNPYDKKALVILGYTKRLQLRVNIAEEDAWRVISGAPGVAFVRGNSKLSVPLTFAYIEPLIVAKNALTGIDTERVDTRVLQVIYEFEKGDKPIYVGQLLDVYLEAKPVEYHAH